MFLNSGVCEVFEIDVLELFSGRFHIHRLHVRSIIVETMGIRLLLREQMEQII